MVQALTASLMAGALLARGIIGAKADPVNFAGIGGAAYEYNYTATGSFNQSIMPANFTPAGGIDTNDSSPTYHPFSDFDYQSLSLALYHEYIEYDLFNYGLTKFSDAEFDEAGIDAEYRHLIRFMAQQEIGHIELITNMLGPNAPKACSYQYNFDTVGSFIDFAQTLTKWSESGVYGFLPHLDSRAAAALLLQSITTEARQQMSLRQLQGLFPYPVWFETGIPQSFAWSLIAPFIVGCPAENEKLVWQNFPALHLVSPPVHTNFTNGSFPQYPNGTYMYPAAVSTNRTFPLSLPGQIVELAWDAPGMAVGPNSSYITSTSAGTPRYAAWISQLNVTYAPLNITGNNSGVTYQPSSHLYNDSTQQVINGTNFLVLVDEAIPVTPFNITAINEHVVAGPLVYESG
ncbi:Protein rds1 [Schizosaccharomyces pombe]